MREIKFRGRRLDNGEWVTGNFETELIDVDPDTVGQYTGLKDKNGREIYEGDVLSCSKYIDGNFAERCCERGYVEFKDGAFGLHRKQGYYRPFRDWFDGWDFEVIGNVHEPELLT